MAIKRCSTCSFEMDTDKEPIANHFYRDSRKKTGYASQCKKCKFKSHDKRAVKIREDRYRSKNELKNKARQKSYHHYKGANFKCSVIPCQNDGIELHHVNYLEPLEVVPLCKKHHWENHEVSRPLKKKEPPKPREFWLDPESNHYKELDIVGYIKTQDRCHKCGEDFNK